MVSQNKFDKIRPGAMVKFKSFASMPRKGRAVKPSEEPNVWLVDAGQTVNRVPVLSKVTPHNTVQIRLTNK